MRRFYLPPDQCRSNVLVLTDREARHSAQVLRLTRGDPLAVLDGAGQELECQVTEATRQCLRLEVQRRRHFPPVPHQITLLQAIPKGRLIEDIIEKATELGVYRVVPLLTDRVATRLDAGEIQARALKWRLTAIEAVKQCGNPWLPLIEAPTTPLAFLQRREACDLAVVASLTDAPTHLYEPLRRYQEQHLRWPRSVHVWIGPEGDFTPEELASAKSGGAVPVSLGRLVLRCETAALYCLSALNHELSKP
jgi:16S rRNA (uracil1498-N3)-methyltransferase